MTTERYWSKHKDWDHMGNEKGTKGFSSFKGESRGMESDTPLIVMIDLS